MLGPEMRRDHPRENERFRGRGMMRPRLRRSLPFVAAFVAGFLLGRQDGGDPPEEWTDDEEVDVREAVARVRRRMMLTGIGGVDFEEGDDAGVERPRTAGGATGVADESPETDEETGVDVEIGDDDGIEVYERVGTDEEPQIDDATGATDATGPDEVTTADESDEIDEAVDELSAPSVRGIPVLGVGTAEDWDYDECFGSILKALRIGYRHVDATERREAYHNEAPVGDAVAESGVPREEVFVATKVSPADLSYDNVLTSVDQSLDRLGLDYVDLLYVHWPTGEYDPEETLAAFAELRREGRVAEIGVSNFTVDLLEEAIEVSEVPIFANQVEMHPLLPQEDLREFCARDDVDAELVAYSPIARGDVEDVTELQEVAAKREITPEQVSLAWLREKGVAAIPEATTEDHLRENWLSLGVDLDEEDVEKLDAIEERRRIVDPDEAPWNT
jgi:2,5-diketo-D-gluconate reductase B